MTIRARCLRFVVPPAPNTSKRCGLRPSTPRNVGGQGVSPRRKPTLTCTEQWHRDPLRLLCSITCQEGGRCSDSRHTSTLTVERVLNAVCSRSRNRRAAHGPLTERFCFGLRSPELISAAIPATVKHVTHEVCSPGHSTRAQPFGRSLPCRAWLPYTAIRPWCDWPSGVVVRQSITTVWSLAWSSVSTSVWNLKLCNSPFLLSPFKPENIMAMSRSTSLLASPPYLNFRSLDSG